MIQLDYEIYAHKTVIEDAKKWCYEQWGARWQALGNRQGTWSVVWAGREQAEYYRWNFATEQQALLFTLKWAK